MAPPSENPKTFRRINAERQNKKSGLTEKAINRGSVAKKRADDAKKAAAEKKAQKASLDKLSEEEKKTETVKANLAALEQSLKEADTEMKDAEAEIEASIADKKKADIIDEYDEYVEDDHDKPFPSIEKPLPPPIEKETDDPYGNVAALLSGMRFHEDTPDILDLDHGVGLRDSETLVSFKNGFGTSGIVIDNELPRYPIYRIKKDVSIPDGLWNIVETRRGGRKNPENLDKRFTVSDINKIRGIAIAVPPGFLGNVEDLVRPVPSLTKLERATLIAQNKPVPVLVDVQLLIEWKTEFEGRVLSFESRSTCRRIWKKQATADLSLYLAAEHQEKRYREAGGENSVEQSPTPFEILPAASTNSSPGSSASPEPAGPAPAGLAPTGPAPTGPAPTGPAPTGPAPAGPTPGPSPQIVNAATKKAAFDNEFLPDFLLMEGLGAYETLPPAKKGEIAFAFGGFWKQWVAAQA